MEYIIATLDDGTDFESFLITEDRKNQRIFTRIGKSGKLATEVFFLVRISLSIASCFRETVCVYWHDQASCVRWGRLSTAVEGRNGKPPKAS